MSAFTGGFIPHTTKKVSLKQVRIVQALVLDWSQLPLGQIRICVWLLVHQCVWSWPVQWSWLLKGQSVFASPADSTRLSPLSVRLRACMCEWSKHAFVHLMCVAVWECSVSEHVCELISLWGESWKVSESQESGDLLQAPSILLWQLPVARSRLELHVNLGQLDPWSHWSSILYILWSFFKPDNILHLFYINT